VPELFLFVSRHDLVKILHDAAQVEISDSLLGLMQEVRVLHYHVESCMFSIDRCALKPHLPNHVARLDSR